MKLFCISDIHLSFGCENKCMSVFAGWNNHAERLRTNWNNTIGNDDCVVIAGDISWGMTLEQALPDLQFVSSALNGNKILLKGNHDYWWNSVTKMQKTLTVVGITNIDFLHNNAYEIGNYAVCGTRGWNCTDAKSDTKMLQREAQRFEKSIESCSNSDKEVIAFFHYPPICAYGKNEYALKLLQEHEIKRVFSGHIHSSGIESAFVGDYNGIHFDTISADTIDFTPQTIS